MSIYNNPRPGSFIALWLTGLVLSAAFWVAVIYGVTKVIREVFA